MSPAKEDYWPDHWHRMDELWSSPPKSGVYDAKTKQEMIQILWGENRLSECERFIADEWSATRMQSKGADPQFREIVAQHAGISMDLAGYKNAVSDYEINLVRDRYYEPGKVESGVDFNNIGVAYQLLAMSTTESKLRAEYFAKSIENYHLAEAEFRKLNDNDALFNNLANQYGLMHDRNDKEQARSLFSKLQQVDRMPNKDFREMVLEQQ